MTEHDFHPGDRIRIPQEGWDDTPHHDGTIVQVTADQAYVIWDEHPHNTAFDRWDTPVSEWSRIGHVDASSLACSAGWDRGTPCDGSLFALQFQYRPDNDIVTEGCPRHIAALHADLDLPRSAVIAPLHGGPLDGDTAPVTPDDDPWTAIISDGCQHPGGRSVYAPDEHGVWRWREDIPWEAL